MSRDRRRPKAWLLLPLLALLGVLYWIMQTVPLSDRAMRPEEEVEIVDGRFTYSVPLDPRSPWPKFRANAGQTGRSPIRSGRPEPSGRAPWSFPTKNGVFSGAVVDGDGVVYIGSADHTFYAIGPDGRLRWRLETGEVIDSAALLDDRGRVYFGSGDAHVYALDRQDGRVLWRTRAHTVEEVEAIFGLDTHNVDWFEGNVALLADGALVVPNDNQLVYVLDRDTGVRERVIVANELMWSLPAVNVETGRMFAGSQFVALWNVFAWETNTGERAWLSGGLGSNAASPLLTNARADGGLVLGGFDGYVRAYAQNNGKELWSTGTRGHIYASPAQLADGTIVQPSADGSVYALDPEDGRVLWQFDTLEPIRSSPAVDGNGIIYVGSGEGKLFALNSDGTLRWAYQCITEPRNDLNSSPGLGPEGIYIGGESGEIFFVPYDYPLSEAGRVDPRSVHGPGEILPSEGTFLIWAGRFGGLERTPPEAIDANEPLVFRLLVRRGGDTVPSSIDEGALDVDFSGAFAPKKAPIVAMAANHRFVSLIPQETWALPEGGELIIDIRGAYLTGHARIGLKSFWGERGGTFSERVRVRVRPRGRSAMPYQIPEQPGDPATALELGRLAAPYPTMLPSWNQIGFDSLRYLAGFVEGDDASAILWVIPGKMESATGRTVIAPGLEDRFALEVDYDGGLLTLYNYRKFLLSFVGSWDMPFGKYRISTRADPSTGEVQRAPALNALVLGDELDFYGTFLKVMGLTDLWTGHMWVYGGMDARLWNGGRVEAPDGAGRARFSIDGRVARVDVEGSALMAKDHVFGLLLVHADTGKPVHARYARGMKVESDEAGHVTAVTLPLREDIPTGARAYLMVDTYPALRGSLTPSGR